MKRKGKSNAHNNKETWKWSKNRDGNKSKNRTKIITQIKRKIIVK